MKKFFASLFVSAMLFSLFSCSDNFQEDELYFEQYVEPETVETGGSVPENDVETEILTEEEQLSENVVEPEPVKEIELSYHDHGSEYEGYFDCVVKWLAKDENGHIFAEDEYFREGLYLNVSVLTLHDGVPQFRSPSEDAVDLNAELAAKLQATESSKTYVSGVSDSIVSVVVVDNYAVGSEKLRGYSFSTATESKVNMKEYILSRGWAEAEVSALVEKNASLLDISTPLDESDEVEIVLDFGGDWCVIFDGCNRVYLMYTVVHSSEKYEPIYDFAVVELDLGLLNNEILGEFNDIFTWMPSTSAWGMSVWADENVNGLYHVRGYPLLIDGSSDSEKINAQILYNLSGLKHTDLYLNDDGIVFVTVLFEHTCEPFEWFTYAYDTVNHKKVNLKEYIISRGVDIETLESEINAEVEAFYSTKDIDGAEPKFRIDFNGDMRISVKGENEITVFYDYGLSRDGVVTYYNTFEPYNITLK